MKYQRLHSWDVSPAAAIKIQLDLSKRVIKEGKLSRIDLIAGVDVGFPNPKTARAAVVVLSYPDLKLVEKTVAEIPVAFPYVPGLLSFREGPVVLAAIEKVEHEPDLFLFDAQGLSHPRRLGLASHLGLFLDRPSIGVAKSRLVGTIVGDKLIDRGEVVAKVIYGWPNLRGGSVSKPVFISVGHKISLVEAVRLAIPEPTLLAHQTVSSKAGPLSA